MSVNGRECSLDAFLCQDLCHLPKKGALVRVTRQKDSSSPATVKNIVFAEVRSFQGRSPSLPTVSGIIYKKRALIGLDLEKDVLHLKKNGIHFCGNLQVLDTSELYRLQDSAYKSLDTIAVIEENYFEHIRKVNAEVKNSLTSVLVAPCIWIVSKFIF